MLTPWMALIIIYSLVYCSYGEPDDADDHTLSDAISSRIIYPSSSDVIADRSLVACNRSSSMSCVRLSHCATSTPRPADEDTSSKRRGFPKICGWEVQEPKVCCKPKRRQTGVTNLPSALKTAENKTKLKDIFPRNECAAMSFDLNREVRRESRIRRAGFKPTVVGGKDVATASKWPFVVAVLIQLGDEKLFLCGGSLISKTIVLCAAHCFENRIESDTYVVQMGIVKLNPSVGVPSEFAVLDVIVHEGFRPPVLDNDVALMKFAGLKSYSDTVKPVCLPDATIDFTTSSATVVGWGSKEFGGDSSQILQEVTLPVVLNDICNSTYSSIAAVQKVLPNGITKSYMCAGDVNGTRDACQGDSGGPLVKTDDTLRWIQVGIVSGGIGCGTPGIPGIYTRVSQYVDWIRSKV